MTKIVPFERSRRLRLPAAPPKSDIHLQGCDCPACEPYAPSVPRFSDATSSTLLAMLAGMACATAGVAVYDWATAGPGLGAVFGL